MIELCLSAYKTFVEKKFSSPQISAGPQSEILRDPVKYQMWHSSFDPHTEVPQLPEAELKVPKQTFKSQDISQFLDKYANQSQMAAAALEVTK